MPIGAKKKSAERFVYIVAYDITDDRERRRVNRILDGYGHGVQRSVYVCHISKAQARRMVADLKKLNLQSGFLLSWKLQDHVMPEQIGSCPSDLSLRPERVIII